MRKIPLRRVPVELLGRQLGVLDYGELICNIVALPAGGMTLAEMALPLAIIRAVGGLGVVGEDVLLGAAEWELLVRRLSAHRFPVAAEAYQTFAAAVAQAEQCDTERLVSTLSPRRDAAIQSAEPAVDAA